MKPAIEEVFNSLNKKSELSSDRADKYDSDLVDMKTKGSNECVETLSKSINEIRKKNSRLRKKTLSSNSISKILPFLLSIKDIRTALMLFIVTVLFIVSYLPSILVSREYIKNSAYLFYLYFTNSAINPIIYSFLNKSFRLEIYKFMRKPILIFSPSYFASYNFSSSYIKQN